MVVADRRTTTPNLVILGGPNGAGKTTISREVLQKTVRITEFVNADVIAAGLSGFDPDRAAFAAGRIMLARLKELAAERTDFAFESTLASRSFAPWARGLSESGYTVHVHYVWLRSPRLAFQRVRQRVREGGHFIPEAVVHRRYARSVRNLVHLYLPLADRWAIYDNSWRGPARDVATGGRGLEVEVIDDRSWTRIQSLADQASAQDDE